MDLFTWVHIWKNEQKVIEKGPEKIRLWTRRRIVGGPRKVDSPKKKKVEKPQDGRQKSCPNIGNLYQMEDNTNPRGRREAPPPWGGAEGAALLSPVW